MRRQVHGKDVFVDVPERASMVPSGQVPGGRIREAVGVFHRAADLQNAVDELLSSGFDRAELSLLGSERAVTAKLGRDHGRPETLADCPATPRTAYVAPESIGDAQGSMIGGLAYVGGTAAAGAIVASGGTLVAAIVAAILMGGAGGLAGSFLAKWLGDHQATLLEEHLNKGGLLLWVRTWDAQDETRALAILRRHSSTDAHVHTFPVDAGRGAAPAGAVDARTALSVGDSDTRHRERMLDDALAQTFPASDPVAIDVGHSPAAANTGAPPRTQA